jgi:hypothetical protein
VKWGTLLLDRAYSEEMRRKVAGIDPDGAEEEDAEEEEEAEEEQASVCRHSQSEDTEEEAEEELRRKLRARAKMGGGGKSDVVGLDSSLWGAGDKPKACADKPKGPKAKRKWKGAGSAQRRRGTEVEVMAEFLERAFKHFDLGKAVSPAHPGLAPERLARLRAAAAELIVAAQARGAARAAPSPRASPSGGKPYRGFVPE